MTHFLFSIKRVSTSQGHLRTPSEDDRELQEVSCPCFDEEFLTKLPAPDEGVKCRSAPMAAYWSTWSEDQSEFAHVYAYISKDETKPNHSVCRAWVFLNGQRVIFETQLNLSSAQAQECISLIRENGFDRDYDCF